MKDLFSHLSAPLRDPRLWVLVGIVLLGRMAYFAYWGVLLEIDSVGYLELQTTLYHPPGYMVLNALLLGMVDSLEVVVVGQSLFYGYAAAIFLWRWVPSARLRLALAVALAAEPLSGKLGCTVMTETLFLALLLLAMAWLPWLTGPETRRWMVAAVAIGLLLGLAYVTRYAAPVFLVALLLWMLMQRRGWRRMLLSGILMVAAFQFAILPLRMYYQVNFGTLRFNAFSDLSLWNSTAYLYPGSEAATDARSAFEQQLRGRPSADFDLYETWHTNQMFHDSCAFQRHVRGMSTAATLAAAREAGRVGQRLLREAPLRHFFSFVVPNVRRPFTKTDTIYADLLPPLIDHGLAYQPFPIHIYHPSWWCICFGSLLIATIGYGLRRKKAPTVILALLLSCWLYLAGIALLAVIFLRFLYVLGPLVVLALGLLASRWTAEPQSMS